MEKRFAVKLFICFVLFLLCAVKTFAQLVYVTPENGDEVFVGKSVLMSVFIQDASLYNFHADAPAFDDDITFGAMRTYDYFLHGRRGVRVELELSFNKEGVFQLDPLHITVSGQSIYIPFAQIFVTQDLGNVAPSVLVRLETEKKAGDKSAAVTSDNVYASPVFEVDAGTKIYVTVKLLNAKKFEQLSWQIPEHSLFSQLEQYRDGAMFEWIPLVAENAKVPIFTVAAVANNNEKIEVSSAYAVVSVRQGQELHGETGTSSTADASSSVFDVAFTATDEQTGEKIAVRRQLTISDCEILAAKMGVGKNRFRIALYVFLCVALFSAVALFIVLAKRKRFALPVCLFFMACAGAVFCGVKVSRRDGVFTGGNVYAIPENMAGQNFYIEAGEQVRVIQSAGEWLFIKTDKSGGWVLSDSVISIK